MTNLPAAVWNQIAEQQDLETSAGRLAFNLNPNQLCQMEDCWMGLEHDAGTPEDVARCLPFCLPTLSERRAIGNFLGEHPEFRDALPEINSPREAAELMRLEWRLSPQDGELLVNVLASPEALHRWERSAQLASSLLLPSD